MAFGYCGHNALLSYAGHSSYIQKLETANADNTQVSLARPLCGFLAGFLENEMENETVIIKSEKYPETPLPREMIDLEVRSSALP